MDKKLVRERHWQTQVLVDVLAATKTGEVVTYDELAKRCKIDVQAVKKRMTSARNIVLLDHKVLIDSVRGVGVVRLDQQNVTAPVARQRGRMRSAARKGIKLINNGVTEWEKLDRDTKTTLFMERAVFGATVLVTDRNSRRVLKEHADTTNAELNIGRTLELVR